jgi:hypothetical protein
MAAVRRGYFAAARDGILSLVWHVFWISLTEAFPQPGSSFLTFFAVLKGLRNRNLSSLSSLFGVIILGRQLLFLGGAGEVNSGRSLLAVITLRTAAAFLLSLMEISLGATPSVNNF